jgi:hypothetical protein
MTRAVLLASAAAGLTYVIGPETRADHHDHIHVDRAEPWWQVRPSAFDDRRIGPSPNAWRALGLLFSLSSPPRSEPRAARRMMTSWPLRQDNLLGQLSTLLEVPCARAFSEHDRRASGGFHRGDRGSAAARAQRSPQPLSRFPGFPRRQRGVPGAGNHGHEDRDPARSRLQRVSPTGSTAAIG